MDLPSPDVGSARCRCVGPARVAVLAAFTTTAAPAAAAPTPAGWQQVWADDFDGPQGAAPDSNTWIVDTGTGYPGGPANWGTGEQHVSTSDAALGYWSAFWALGSPYRGN